MSSGGQSEAGFLKAALGPGDECPPLKELRQVVIEGTSSPLAGHVESCGYCRTEVALLREFLSGRVRGDESRAVRAVVDRLQARTKDILAQRPVTPASDPPWWKSIVAIPWVIPAALVMSLVFLVMTISFQVRRKPPQADAPRSAIVRVTSPVGEVATNPTSIRWDLFPGAATYQAELLEVDGTELWRGSATANQIAIPFGLQSRMLPGKTLICRVTAFDSGGRRLAESEPVRFRVVPR